VRTRFALLLLAVLVAVPAAIAATPDFKPERKRLNAADVKLAKSVALKRADLGAGWTAFSYGDATGDDADLSACSDFDLDLSAFTITGQAKSAFRNGSGASVSSAVEVYLSRAQAAGDFRAATRHAKLFDCFRTTLEKSLAEQEEQGLTMQLGSIARRAFPRIGEQTFAFRTVTRVTFQGVTVSVFIDSVSFQRGRTIASLTFINGLTPYARQAPLARAVAARMRQ
jgi:hypothetical protein